jgi:hypothetical protein
MKRCTLALALLAFVGGPAFADCQDELQAVVDKHPRLGPYRVEMTMTGGDNPTAITAEVIMPDRFRMTMPQGQAVIIGDKSWMNMGGQWMEIPGLGGTITSMVKQAELVSAEAATNLACSDAERDGRSFRLIEFDASGKPMGIEATSHVKLYLDPSTGLPAIQQIDGEAGGMKSSILQTITFDPSIVIEPPQ